MNYYAVMTDKAGLKITVEELTEKSDSFLLYQAKDNIKKEGGCYSLNEYYTFYEDLGDARTFAKTVKYQWCSIVRERLKQLESIEIKM